MVYDNVCGDEYDQYFGAAASVSGKEPRGETGSVLCYGGVGNGSVGRVRHSLPSNWIAAQISGWGLGFFSVAGIVVYIKAKNDRQRQIAGILVAVSVVGAILKLFVL